MQTHQRGSGYGCVCCLRCNSSEWIQQSEQDQMFLHRFKNDCFWWWYKSIWCDLRTNFDWAYKKQPTAFVRLQKMKCKWHDRGRSESSGDQVFDWWPLDLFIFCRQWGRGDLFSAHTGAIWHTGNTFVGWRKSSGSCLMMFSMSVWVCVPAHLLKAQCLSEIMCVRMCLLMHERLLHSTSLRRRECDFSQAIWEKTFL